MMAVSERAVERARGVENRGFYFDFVRHYAAYEKRQGITTPSTSHLYALDLQLSRILEETMPVREARHRAMAERTREWARERFALFAEEGHESITLTAIRNTRGIDVPALNRASGGTWGRDRQRVRPSQERDLPDRPHGRDPVG